MGETPAEPTTILTCDQCWVLLRSCDVGRLAISIAGQPDIFPVNFVVDHGAVVFRTAEGTKLAAAVLGRGVAFEVDGYDAMMGEAWSVVVKGEAREIERMHELFDAADLPLFPWGMQDPSIATSASSPGRSLGAVSASSTQRRRLVPVRVRDGHHWSDDDERSDVGA